MAYRKPVPYRQQAEYYESPRSASTNPTQEYEEAYEPQSYQRPGTAQSYKQQSHGHGNVQDSTYGRAPQPSNQAYVRNHGSRQPYNSHGASHRWEDSEHSQPYRSQNSYESTYQQGQSHNGENNGNGYANASYADQNNYGQPNDPYRRPGTAVEHGNERPIPYRTYSDNQSRNPAGQDNVASNYGSRKYRNMDAPLSPTSPSWDNSYTRSPNRQETRSQEAKTGTRPPTSSSRRSEESGQSYRVTPDSRNTPTSRPSVDSNRERYNRSASGNGYEAESSGYPLSSFENGQPANHDRSRQQEQWSGIQRSQTMPIDVFNETADHNMSAHELPFRQGSNSYRGTQATDDQPQNFGPPARAATFDTQNSYLNSSNHREPPRQPSHAPHESYGDVFDSYYTDPGQPAHGHSRSVGEEDMPNFNAVGSTVSQSGDKSLHLGYNSSQIDQGYNIPQVKDHRGEGRSLGSRSRSQPNLRQDQALDEYGYPLNAPPMPAVNNQPQNPGDYPLNGSSNAREPPAQGRMNQRPPGRFPGINGNYGAPRGGQYNAAVSGSRRGGGPAPNRAPGGPGLSGQRGPAPRPYAQPQNPDALPEHPVPIRPGHMQAINTPQSQMPPPVRQYTNNTPPNPPVNNVPQQAPPPSQQGDGDHQPVTKAELDTLRRRMQDSPSDQATDLLLAQKLVEASTVLADDGGRADKRTRDKNRERYINDAHRIIKKLISRSYPDAMFYLADCHGTGRLGLPKDPKEAFNLYQSAAKLNHPQAAYRVAVCCEMGQDEGGGTRRDPLKAVQWYKRAATLGDGPGMYKLGVVLLKGLLGQQKNPREAVNWLKRAADCADAETPHALHELGLLYESDSGNGSIIPDAAYAFELFSKAADLGYKFSQYRLGAAYEYGNLGCPIDPRMSIAWYSKAALLEEHQSELALSGWYLTGSEGIIQQSDTEAYLWARKAAMAGLPKAEYAMGYFTETGIGCPADLEGAKRWYWRAASQNFPKAKERLEDLRKGGQRMQQSRVSRSAVHKNDADCTVM